MTKFTPIVAVLIWLFPPAPAARGSELVGMVVPPLPSDIFEDGGICIGRSESTLCERNIALLKTAAGRDFLIYTGSEEPSEGKKPRWRITDTLAFPRIPSDAEFVWQQCRNSGTFDSSVVAVVRSDSNQEWLRARDWAYRVDYETGKFVKLDPKNVDCSNFALDGED